MPLPLHFDPALSQGARNAVRTCLRIEAGHRVTVITDHESAEIAAAIAAELTAIQADFRVWILEEEGARPRQPAQ